MEGINWFVMLLLVLLLFSVMRVVKVYESFKVGRDEYKELLIEHNQLLQKHNDLLRDYVELIKASHLD